MIPPFLTGYTSLRPSTAQVQKLQSVLTNWLKVHSHISKLDASAKSVRELADLMFIECYRKGGPRMDILVRLHGRFNKLRFEVERVELGNRRHR